MLNEPCVEVRTERGRVLGRMEPVGGARGGCRAAVAVFRGIPFAKPPLGALRFAAPEPPAAWDGSRPATRFGPPVPQYDRMNPPAAGQEAEGGPEPDCLSVNVWSPGLGATGLPVMVWFHGGAYAFGHSGDPAYDGALLASEGVVVVTFNYRVGMEGFGQIEGAPANRGLLDQLAALRWVRDNIAAFGGDPDRVTAFGESAGAGSIAALLASDAADGLFGRAITQSVPGSYFTPDLAADIADAVARLVGRAPTAEALRTVEPSALVRAAEEVHAERGRRAGRWGVVAHAETLFSPVVDGRLPARTPWDALAAGAARGVGLMAGCNHDEYRLFMAKRREFGRVSAERAAWAMTVFGAEAGGERACIAAFPGLGDEELYERVCSDWLCRVPTLRLLEAAAEAGGRAFGYELRWPAPVLGGLLGACHGLDVPLVLGTLDAPASVALLGPGPSEEAEALSRRMRTAWVRFAATGDPGWPAYDTDGRLTKVFDRRDSVEPDPLGASRVLWGKAGFGVLGLADHRSERRR
ncbi:carboxylesterase/lipase family protein [Streptomyces sp. NPDC050255]|uniref:carboxylesterase/lipase family protein n=1 Tax=Streptomyces sp. NPDC050255 TaxID=3365606 RepID=UPI00379D1F15